MIKYHGTPITPKRVFEQIMPTRNALISYAHSGDLERALKICDNVIIDNGAFSFWTKGKKVEWNKYYEWIEKFEDKIEFYIIPDVIDGTEEENDKLILDYFERNLQKESRKGVPVFHIAESFDRLYKLLDYFDYICLGSSGEYGTLGTEKWHIRMNDIMRIVCDKRGVPKVKLHMLRCLDPRLFTKYPFYSGDSTNLARNHARDGSLNILKRIEPYNSPKNYKFKKYYTTRSLF